VRTIDDLLALAALVRDLKGEDETAARPPDLVRLVVDDVTLLRGDGAVPRLLLLHLRASALASPNATSSGKAPAIPRLIKRLVPRATSSSKTSAAPGAPTPKPSTTPTLDAPLESSHIERHGEG